MSCLAGDIAACRILSETSPDATDMSRLVQLTVRSQVDSVLNGGHVYDHSQQVFEEAEGVNSLKVRKWFQVA